MAKQITQHLGDALDIIPRLTKKYDLVFIDADKKQIEAALECGAPVIEIHTGHFADAETVYDKEKEYQRIIEAVEFADNAGISGSKYLQDAMMKRIDDLRPKIESYLCDNKADYPLFNDDDCPCSDCEDGCTTSCRCGYWQTYGTPCRTCKTGINSSTKIIFY